MKRQSQATTESELRRLNWALEAYVRSSSALRRQADVQEIASGVTAAIVENESYLLACVGLAVDAPGRPFRFIATAGSAAGYAEGLELSWDADRPEGQGPTGRSVRQGEPLIMRDSRTDPLFAPWRERGDRYGIRSSVTAPFKREGRVLGALLVYAAAPDAFGPRELSVFQNLGDELALAIQLADDRERLAAAESARRAAEEALRDSQAELARIARISALGEFAATVAHEINQPLSAIVTNSDAAERWLARGPEHLDQVVAAIQRTQRDARRASEVIQRIRDAVTRQPSRRDRLDLGGTLRQAVQLAEPQMRKAGVSVVLDIADTLPAVNGDRVQLQQVLVNLMLNGGEAMQATPPDRRQVTVRASTTADGAAEVRVSDRGCGLDAAGAARLFEHFVTTKQGGTGLGLAISRSIIAAHRGRIWAEPGPDGEGAIFAFTLPAAG